VRVLQLRIYQQLLKRKLREEYRDRVNELPRHIAGGAVEAARSGQGA
jgi:hypothetical protein